MAEPNVDIPRRDQPPTHLRARLALLGLAAVLVVSAFAAVQVQNVHQAVPLPTVGVRAVGAPTTVSTVPRSVSKGAIALSALTSPALSTTRTPSAMGSAPSQTLPQFGQRRATAQTPAALSPSIGVPAGCSCAISAFDARNGLLYTSNYLADTLSVSNPRTGKLVATVPVGAYPVGVVLDESLGEVFVATGQSNNVSVINTTTNHLVGTVWGVDGGWGMALDTANGDIYTANYWGGGDNISIFNPSTLKVLPKSITVGSAPWGVLYDPNDGDLYVSNFGSSNVTVVNPVYARQVGNFTTRTEPSFFAFDPDNGNVYVADWGGQSLSVITGTGRPVIAGVIYTLSGPYGVAYDPLDGDLVVTAAAGTAVITPYGQNVTSYPWVDDAISSTYDPSNGVVYVATQSSGGLLPIANVSDAIVSATSEPALDLDTYVVQPAYDPVANELFVPNAGADSVEVFSEPSGELLGAVPVGASPWECAYDGINGYVYCANAGSQNVSVLSAGSSYAIATISLPSSNPYGVAVDSSTGAVYVSDLANNAVWEISGSTFGVVNAILAPGHSVYSIAFDPSNGYLYTGFDSGWISVISTLNFSKVGLLPLSNEFTSLTVDSDYGQVVATEYFENPHGYDGNVTALSTATGSVVWNDEVGSNVDWYNTYWNPDDDEVYAGTASQGVWTFGPSGLDQQDLSYAYELEDSAVVGFAQNLYSGMVYAYAVLPGPPSFPNAQVYGIDGGVDGWDLSESSWAEVGAQDTFSVAPLGLAAAPYETTLLGLPGCTSPALGLSVTCTPSTAGTFLVTAVVLDSSNMYREVNATFTVYPAPSVSVAVSPTSGDVDVGQPLTFTATPSGGVAGGAYTWGLLPSTLSCQASTRATFDCVAVAPGGPSTVSVSWTDGAEVSTPFIASPPVTVSRALSIGIPVASSVLPNAGDAGETVVFSVVAGGGAPAYSYTWYGLPGCTTTDSSWVACTLTTAGPAAINVSVADANGETVWGAALNYTVDPAPSVTAVSASPNPIEAGSVLRIAASVSGGAPGGYFTWTGLTTALNCQNATDSIIVCAPSLAATASTVSVRWTDGNGVTTAWMASSAITVLSPPALTAVSASVNALDVGQSVKLTTTATSGDGSYTFSWWGLPSAWGCTASATTSVATLSCTPTSAGTFTADASVVDTLGGTATAVPALLVVSPALGTPTVSASTNSIQVGQDVVFTATVSGGASPYTYAWSGLPSSGCTSPSAAVVACAPTASGSISASVKVTDANGVASSASATVSVTVAAAPAASASQSSLNSLSGLVYAALGLAIVGLLLGLLALLMKGRKSSPPPSRSSEPVASSTTAPAPPPSAPSEPTAPPPPTE